MSVRGTLFIVSAPSGGGKTSLVAALTKQIPNVKISISHTTRPIRSGESEGKNYFFINKAEFDKYREDELFLEYAQVFNHWYGTSKVAVQTQLEAGFDVVLDIDWQGARQIKEQMECVSIFIIPPSATALLKRLKDRNQDSDEIIVQRMNLASQEISHYKEYDYLIINDDFNEALTDLTAIVRTYRLNVTDAQHRYADVLRELIGKA